MKYRNLNYSKNRGHFQGVFAKKANGTKGKGANSPKLGIEREANIEMHREMRYNEGRKKNGREGKRMRERPCVFGIDIGTTSICAAAVDPESGHQLVALTHKNRAALQSDDPWRKEQDTGLILADVHGLIDGLTAEGYTPTAIGLAGQMHGIVYADGEGRPLSPLYTWQDGRGNEPYKNTTYAEFLKSNTGYGNVTDFYNRENGLVPKTAENYCTIHDYFVMQLCGLKKAIIHTSDAASFGRYDLKTNSFTYDCDLNITADYTIAGTYKNIPSLFANPAHVL